MATDSVRAHTRGSWLWHFTVTPPARWTVGLRARFCGTDAFTVLGRQRRDVNAWLVLFVAGLFEAVWAVGLAYTDGFTKPLPSVVTLAAMAVSVYLLAQAVQELPIGTAYAVWTGIGAVTTASFGIYLFDEPASALRVGFILLVVVGIAGLQVTGSHAG